MDDGIELSSDEASFEDIMVCRLVVFRPYKPKTTSRWLDPASGGMPGR